MSKHWDASLCGCMDDCGSCYCTFCVPFGAVCTHIQVTSKASGGGCCGPCCCVYLCGCIGCAINRKRIRHELDLKGSFWGDCCTWFYCAPCAASQEYREWHNHGKKH